MKRPAVGDVLGVAHNSGIAFDQAAIGMALIDLDGRYLRVNETFCVFLGRSEQSLLGATWQSVTDPGDVERGERAVARALAGEERTFQLSKRYVRGDGELVWALLSASVIRTDEGEARGLFTQVVDITEQRKAEEALQAALGEARDAEARSRRLLADAAHHLRNPLAGIRACAETLLRESEPAANEHLLVGVVRQTARVSRLVDRLLRISRLEGGESLLLERCDLVTLCREEAEKAAAFAPNVDILVALDEASWLDVDRNAVREIVANLLENARRHAVERIDVTVSRTSGALQVRVHDDGPGLPDAMVERAFEPFVSLDGRGGGLGLPLARLLARAHGGDLTYRNGGFLLSLPLRADADGGDTATRVEGRRLGSAARGSSLDEVQVTSVTTEATSARRHGLDS